MKTNYSRHIRRLFPVLLLVAVLMVATYATNASGSWATSTIDPSGYVGLYSSLAFDPSNNVHISYYDGTI